MSGIFKSLLAEDRLIRVFALGRIPSPVVVEMVSLAGGYDGIWLDQEHGGLSTEQMVHLSYAARATGLGCFARIATTHYSLVNQSLESGLDGVMAARINNLAEAEQFVRWAKFAPLGLRGLNTSGADGHFTWKSATKLAEDANRDQFLAIQIETLGAVGDADAIAALEGVDMLFVGPSDLSQEIGITGQWDDSRLWDAISVVSKACRTHGKHWGSVSPSTSYARRCVETGCRMLTFGNDVSALRLGIEAVKTNFDEHFSA